MSRPLKFVLADLRHLYEFVKHTEHHSGLLSRAIQSLEWHVDADAWMRWLRSVGFTDPDPTLATAALVSPAPAMPAHMASSDSRLWVYPDRVCVIATDKAKREGACDVLCVLTDQKHVRRLCELINIPLKPPSGGTDDPDVSA